MSETINLGDRVKDQITGVQGIVVSVTDWLYNCRRIGVQPEAVDKDGKKRELEYFDEPQLTVVKAHVIRHEAPKVPARTGGPGRPEPPTRDVR